MGKLDLESSFSWRQIGNKLVTSFATNLQQQKNKLTFTKKQHMINDAIAKFVEAGYLSKSPLKIEFKKRNAIFGIFVKSPDYEELKSKNFWRIVGEANIGEWQKNHDNNLAKIFNGAEFNRIAVPKQSAVIAE